MTRFNVKLSGKLGGALRKAKRFGAEEDLPDDTRTHPTTEGIQEFEDTENWINSPHSTAINMLMQRDEVMSRMYEEGRMRGFSKGVVSMIARDLLKKNWLSLDPGESHYSYTPSSERDIPDEVYQKYLFDDSDPQEETQGPSVEEYLSRSRARLPEFESDKSDRARWKNRGS